MYGPSFPTSVNVPSFPSLAKYVFPANLAIRAIDPGAKAGYTQSWNATLERQVAKDTAVTISWVGNHAIGIMTRYQDDLGDYSGLSYR